LIKHTSQLRAWQQGQLSPLVETVSTSTEHSKCKDVFIHYEVCQHLTSPFFVEIAGTSCAYTPKVLQSVKCVNKH